MSEAEEGIKVWLFRLDQGENIPDEECYRIIDLFNSSRSPTVQLVVEKLIGHSSHLVRLMALNALVNGEWAKKEYLSLILLLLRNEKDDGMRAVLVSAIAVLPNSFQNQEVLSDLLQIIKRRTEHPNTRLAAYNALLGVVAEPLSKRIVLAEGSSGDPDHDIDWELIASIEKSFLQGG